MEARPAPLHIDLLGGFRVRVGHHVVPDSAWRLSKARTLLKVLALAHGHRLSRDQALDLLWPDLAPEAAANNLYGVLHGVRRVLRTGDGEAELRFQHGLLSLQPEGPLHIDVDAFETAAARAQGSNDPALYYAALSRYSGDLLPDDLYEDWAAERREALREIHLGLLVAVARRHEARGELKAAMEALRRVIQSERTHEEAHQELMRLYASTGQRDRALRQFAQLQDILRDELEAEPDAGAEDLYRAIRAGHFAGAEPAEPSTPQHNLSLPLTSFVGREQELAEIKSVLATTRLLTLTGLGGVGKTRLALRAAWDLLGSYRDGIWFVPLASVADGARLPEVVAQTLPFVEHSGMVVTEALMDVLRERQILLILDNCEHLGMAPAQLAGALLGACADLQIIATSRARLGVPGEMLFPVGPLATSPLPTPEAVASSDAVRLFAERARFRRPGFTLTAATVGDVAEICHRVEGIPLAIELAAARAGAFSLEEIAARLADAPGFLSSGDSLEERHSTLDAVLNWSYHLLDPPEARLFRRLSVFRGGWTLEAAEAIGEEGTEPAVVLEQLSRLIDKSLVTVRMEGPDAARYRLPEPVRQYAARRLAEDGEEEAIHRRHAVLFAALAQQAEPELVGPDQVRWIRRLDADHDNLRAALRWAIDRGEADLAFSLGAHLWWFWYLQSHLAEGREWLDSLLQLEGGNDDDRAAVLRGAGSLAYAQRQYDTALHDIERSLALYRQASNRPREASCLNTIAVILAEKRDYSGARRYHEESLAIRRELGDKDGVAVSLSNLGVLAYWEGDYARADALWEECIALNRELGDTTSLAIALSNVGSLALGLGQYERAVPPLAEALELSRAIDEREILTACLDGLAEVVLWRGDARRAAIIHGAADALRAAVGHPLRPSDQADHDAAIGRTRAALGSEAFAAAWAEGQTAGLDEIIGYALRGEGSSPRITV